MNKYFCCPECGNKKITFVNDKKQFSLAKTAILFPFIGVWAILVGFLSGQTGVTVSTLACRNCNRKFVDPYESIISLEKNAKAATVILTVLEILLVLIESVTYFFGFFINMCLTFIASRALEDFIMVAIVGGIVVGVLIIAVTIIVMELIKFLFNKSFMKQISLHENSISRMRGFFETPPSMKVDEYGDFESF